MPSEAALIGRRVLVTGAGGFIGARLAERLAARGAVVTAQCLPGESVLDSGDMDVCTVDFRDAQATHQLVGHAMPEVVFHLAAAGVTDPFLPLEDALQVNLYGTLRLLRAAGSARVVMARTVGERTNLNPYAASKSAAWAVAEMLHRTKGLPLVGLMLYQVYGPGQAAGALVPSAVRAALAGEHFPMTHGRQVRDWVYVDDVIDAFVAAARAEGAAGRTFEIGAGEGASLYEVVECIWHIVEAVGLIRAGALTVRPGEVDEQVADPAPAARGLGWRAQVSLDVGLQCTIDEMRRAHGS